MSTATEETKKTGTPVEKTAKFVTYRTPRVILDPVDAFFGGRIPLDPCTDNANWTNAARFFTEAQDGLAQDWVMSSQRQGAFVNPPYGRFIKPWLLKIKEEAERNLPLLVLIPVVRTEQRYFTEVVELANVVCWVRKRVGFIDPVTNKRAGSNPHASALWGFNVRSRKFRNAFCELGMIQAVQVL